MLIDRHLSNKAQKKFYELSRAIEKQGEVACQSFPDMMYEEAENIESRLTREMIKEICQSCPVKNLCLDYAIEAKEEYGIWGGLTTRERNQLTRFAKQLQNP